MGGNTFVLLYFASNPVATTTHTVFTAPSSVWRNFSSGRTDAFSSVSVPTAWYSPYELAVDYQQ